VKRSLTITVTVGLVLLALGLLPWAVWWSDLPPRLATHWDLLGRADGSQSRFTAFLSSAVPAALLVLAWLGSVLWRATRDARDARDGRDAFWLAGLGFLAGLLAGLSATTAWANRGVASWPQADLGVWWLAALVLAVACARLGAAIERRLRPGGTSDAAPPEGIELAPDELVAWSGTAVASNRVRLALVVVPPAIGLWLHVDLVVPLALGVLLAALGSVRVTVGAHGLRVRPGVLRWPAVHLPLARIVRADPIDLRPLRWGGWGYRGSLRFLRRAAWVVRRGPGLRVELTNGDVFAVTVDHPDQAAAVLNGLRSRLDPDPASQAAG
jgi:Protein of unknown function (DUF1648)